MALFAQSTFKASGIHSLCWRGDQLVDWVGGGRCFDLDGTETPRNVRYGYRFDAATASPDGRFAVIYERLGTKGLLLRDGKIVREIDRSYYFADSYEYPVALFNGPDGRLLLVHCPRNYCDLELEDAETGLALTSSAERKQIDFFHSRLTPSPYGKRLLSAGWVWHPASQVECFDVAEALADPNHLDQAQGLPSSFKSGLDEDSSACWLDDDSIVVAVSASPTREDDTERYGLAVYDMVNPTCRQVFQLDDPAGTILPVGMGHVLSLYRHPKLIDLSTGKVVHAWTELRSGLQDSSLMRSLNDETMPPAMAFDRLRGRFAIVNGDTVTLIDFQKLIAA